MANITIEKRVEREFRVPFKQWVRQHEGKSLRQLAGEADSNVLYFKEALKRNGLAIVSVNRVVSIDEEANHDQS